MSGWLEAGLTGTQTETEPQDHTATAVQPAARISVGNTDYREPV